MNSGTAVDICDAPANLVTRDIDFISIRNNDTASVTVTVRYNDNGTTYKIIVVTLLTLETLTYTAQAGWIVTDTGGSVKTALSGGASISWTPTVTFATPGDLVAVYSERLADYTTNGNVTLINYSIITSTFTHTTAAGSLQITGCPVMGGSAISLGAVLWSGITKATYTHVYSFMTAASTIIAFAASGSGVAASNIAFGDVPTGGTVRLRGTISIRA